MIKSDRSRGSTNSLGTDRGTSPKASSDRGTAPEVEVVIGPVVGPSDTSGAKAKATVATKAEDNDDGDDVFSAKPTKASGDKPRRRPALPGVSWSMAW